MQPCPTGTGSWDGKSRKSSIKPEALTFSKGFLAGARNNHRPKRQLSFDLSQQQRSFPLVTPDQCAASILPKLRLRKGLLRRKQDDAIENMSAPSCHESERCWYKTFFEMFVAMLQWNHDCSRKTWLVYKSTAVDFDDLVEHILDSTRIDNRSRCEIL